MNGDNERVILLIESDPVASQAAEDYLLAHGYQVLQAGSGRRGIELFHERHPDIIICDLNLPDMDGFEALETILTESPDIPIVVLADRSSTHDAIKAIRLGVSDYLLKPVEDLEILGLSVVNSLRRAALLSENSRYRKKLEMINRELEDTVVLFKLDQQAGRHVQMSMLPRSPLDIAGYHFQHCVIPSLYLSGDSVDYKPVSRQRVLFYIADVSGHGSSSAFLTVLLRFRIEQLRREHIRSRFTQPLSPALLLKSLNRDLLDAGLDKHITMVAGVLDRENNTLLYSVAGHYPLPVLYRDGRAAFIDLSRASLPIGLSDEAEYFESTMAFEPGASMTMFSDGIMEILDAEASTGGKEGYLLAVIEACEGRFERIRRALNLDDLSSVPDDIAMMSVLNP